MANLFEFTIDAPVPEMTKHLDTLQRKQIPFATALALTRTAQDAREAVREVMPKRFTIRKPYVVRGVAIQKATKKRLRAIVFHRDKYMADQEYGGQRYPQRRFHVIPLGIRKHKKQNISKAKLPSRVKLKPTVSLVDSIKNKRDKLILQRVGRGKNVGRKTLYLLKRGRQKIKPRFGMDRTVRTTVRRRFTKNFGRAIAKALRTAR